MMASPEKKWYPVRCQETQKMEKQLKDLVEVQKRLECMAQGLWSCEEDEKWFWIELFVASCEFIEDARDALEQETS